MPGRHAEFFGPDLGRGPFASQRIETAALQIATALAQLRAPLSRSDDAIREHVDFIREIANQLAPDWAEQIDIDVGDYATGFIPTNVNTVIKEYSLIECWLADTSGGGVTSTTPDVVTWNTGTVLQTIVSKKHYLIVTPHTGVLQVTVGHGSAHTWYWAFCRKGRIYYSSQLYFA